MAPIKPNSVKILQSQPKKKRFSRLALFILGSCIVLVPLIVYLWQSFFQSSTSTLTPETHHNVVKQQAEDTEAVDYTNQVKDTDVAGLFKHQKSTEHPVPDTTAPPSGSPFATILQQQNSSTKQAQNSSNQTILKPTAQKSHVIDQSAEVNKIMQELKKTEHERKEHHADVNSELKE